MSTRNPTAPSPRVRASQLRSGDRIMWGPRIVRIESVTPADTVGHVIVRNEHGQSAPFRARALVHRIISTGTV